MPDIVGFIKRHRQLDYIQKVVRGFFRPAFKKTVLAIDDDPNLLLFEHLGEESHGRLVYLITSSGSLNGFFSQHRILLHALSFADDRGLVPAVYYGADFLFHEEEPVNGTTNAFEYYFQQPGDITVEQAQQSAHVLRYHYKQAFFNGGETGYSLDEATLARLAEMQRKYIMLQPVVEQRLRADMLPVLGGRVLGIHYRGADFRKNFKGHPIAVTADELIAAAKEAVETQKYDAVFLATDDLEGFDAFRAAFGDKLRVYPDVFRSADAEPVTLWPCERPQHRYQLGSEVLRDAYTLAACDGMVCGLSQVSICAQIIARAEGHAHKQVIILGGEINQTGPSSVTAGVRRRKEISR